MTASRGKHVLIDFYSCYEEPISDENDLIEGFVNALYVSNFPSQEVASVQQDHEYIVSAFDAGCHVVIHAYPDYGYVGLDVYAFEKEVDTSLLMKHMKDFLGAERVKVTSLNRGDFGTSTDMKPRSKTTLTTKFRVKKTGKQLKRTGSSIKRTGLKVLKTIKVRTGKE